MKNAKKKKPERREHLAYHSRVFWIDLKLRSNAYPNSRTIAERFEIDPKTAQRTLDFMRDQLRMPIDYSPMHRGWHYTEPAFALPAIELTEGDLLAILLAEKLSRQYRGTAIGQMVEEAFSKVLSAMTNTITIDLESLREAHSFEASAATEIDADLFRLLGRAVVSGKRVEMTYFTAGSGEIKRRKIDPLHLRNSLGEWYVIAFDHLRGEVRDFHIGRISDLNATEEAFDWPAGFDLDAYLRSGFGMIRGRDPINVEIVFDSHQARWIRERSKLHPTEEREELADGGLRVTMVVTALDGVKRFVMQYGNHAHVIKPEELRESIREEIEKMRTAYLKEKRD